MLKKRKHKFMAFLLSAMMLITGAAMGTVPAAENPGQKETRLPASGTTKAIM